MSSVLPRRLFTGLAAATILGLSLSACGSGEGTAEQSPGAGDPDTKVQIVTSFSILEDMSEQIGGDLVEVYNLVPVGQDPHEYDMRPDDSVAVQNADLLVYHGMNLEGGEQGWVQKLIDSSELDEDAAVEVSTGIDPLYISEGVEEDVEEDADEINPHTFLDPTNGMTIANNLADAFIEIDPDNQEIYEENRDEYLEKLQDVEQRYDEVLSDLAEDQRILFTSERAYQYLAERYDLLEGYIWLIDTEASGSPDQLSQAIDFIEEHQPPVLFVESNVDPRPMETVSDETGVEIFAELYSDELGLPDTDGETYLGYLEYNIETLSEGLAG